MLTSRLWFYSIVSGAIIYFCWPAILVIYLGGLLAFILHPLHTLLRRFLPNGLSALLCLLFFLGTVYLCLITVLPALYSQVQLITNRLSHFNLYTPNFLQRYISQTQINKYSAYIQQSIINNLDFIGGKVVSVLSAQGTNVVLFAGKFYLTTVVAFFVLKDWDKFNSMIRRTLPEEYAQVVIGLFEEALKAIRMLLQGQLIVVSFLTAFYSLGFYLLELPHPILFGMFAGIASLVPYVGMIAISLFTLLYAVNHNLSIYQLLGVLGTFIAGNGIESSVLVPYFLGQKLSIHPVMLIFYMIVLGSLFGVGGVVLALPTAAVLNVLVRRIIQSLPRLLD